MPRLKIAFGEPLSNDPRLPKVLAALAAILLGSRAAFSKFSAASSRVDRFGLHGPALRIGAAWRRRLRANAPARIGSAMPKATPQTRRARDRRIERIAVRN